MTLQFREPSIGPVCCRHFCVGCRLPAQSAALVTCTVLLTVLQEPFIGPLALGTVGPALFAAGPSVLGAVCRPIQLHLETCTVLLIMLQELLYRPFSLGSRRMALLAALCDVYSLLQSACRQSKPVLWDFLFF